MLFAATGAALAVPAPAAGHHGSTGFYDRTRPTYFAGEVVATEYEFPHGEITVQVPAGLAVPADRARFARLDEMDGRPTTGRLTSAAAGSHVLLLPPELTTGIDAAPQVGQQATAVAYPRCPQGNEYDGEYRVQALVTTDGQAHFRRSGSPTGYRDGCPSAQSSSDGRWSTAATVAVAAGAAAVLAGAALLVLRIRRARRG